MADQRKILSSVGARLACVGLASCLYGGSVLAEDEDSEEIEEVVITGSYIKGSPTDAPSPIKVVDRAQFDEEGAFTLFDVVRNLTVNSGSLGNNESGGIGVSNDLVGTQNVNLRGLGPNSTLVLVNGKRLAPVAAQTTSGGEIIDTQTIPSIMTERFEVLLDGGSALYGSDAVAGVFNVIMRTEFEGLEIETQAGGMTESIEDNNERIAGIWGWRSDDEDTHFVLSGEYYHQDEVGVDKANFFDSRLQQFIGHVGSIITPIMGFSGEQLNPEWLNQEIVDQAIAEGGPGGAKLTDPLCSTLTSAGGDPLFVGHQWASAGYPSSQCYEDTSEFRQITTEYERNSIAGSLSHVFNDHLEFYSFFNYSDSEAVWAHDGIVYSPYATYNLAQPGAFDNLLPMGLELGFFAPYVVREGREPLEAPTYIPNHPGAGYNGGPNISTINNQTIGFPRERSDQNSNEQKATIVQLGLKGDFEFADRTLNFDVGLAWSENSLEASGVHFNRTRTELAANGLGGPNCVPNGVDDFDFQTPRYAWDGWNAYDYLGFVTTGSSSENVNNVHQNMSLALTSNNQGVGDCQFLNPYISSLTNPDLANSQELLDWITQDVMLTDKRNQLAVIDAVVSGELFEMAGGTAQFAVGMQYRKETRDSNAGSLLDPLGEGLTDAIKSFNDDGPIYNDDGVMIRESGTVAETHDFISNSLTCDRCSYTFDLERTVSSVFLELSLPIWEDFESQIALRYESYNGNIGSKLTPKIAVSYRPIDTLLLRGSYSQSFRAPNAGVVNNGLGSYGSYVQDPLRSQAVRAGILPPTAENSRGQGAYFVGGPSPDLGPEEADTYSFGFQWTPEEFIGLDVDGFSFGMTYWRFEYSDRVGPQPAHEAFNTEVEAFLIAAADPDNYILNHTQQPYGLDDLTSYKTSCDPIALSAEHGDAVPADPLADIAFPLATTPNPASPNIEDFPRLNCIVDPATYLVDSVQRATGTEATRAAIRSVSAISINAGEIVTDGLDFEVNYHFETDIGLMGINLEYTHVNQYTLRNIPGFDNGFYNTGVIDAAGTTGGEGLVRSLPDNRGHIAFWWRGEHNSVTISNRHIGSYKDLVADLVRETNNAETASRVRDSIPSYDSWDFHYQYRHSFNSGNIESMIVSVNVLDVFNSPLPFRETGSSGLRYDGQAPIDPRGRRFNVVARFIF